MRSRANWRALVASDGAADAGRFATPSRMSTSGAFRSLGAANASVITELRMSVGAAALGREVEDAPHRPDRIDVALILTGFTRRKQSLGGIRVTDSTVRRPNEDVKDWQLVAPGIFAVVVLVVAVGGRRQPAQPTPPALARN